VTGSDDGTAKIWKVSESGTQVVAILQHAAPITDVDVSNKGQVLTTSRDKTAKVWSAKGELLYQWSPHKDFINTGRWSKSGAHGGDYILTSSDDGTAALLDATQKKRCATLRDLHAGHHDEVAMAVFSPLSDTVATCSHDGQAMLWSVSEKSKPPLQVLPGRLAPAQGHDGPVYSVEYNSTGTRVVTAGQDGLAKIWDVEYGKLIATFGEEGIDLAARTMSHSDVCLHAVFEPTAHESYFASCGMDNKAIFWDISTGKPTAQMKEHTGAIWSAQFSSDDGGKRLLVCSHDMAATIYDTHMLKKVDEKETDQKVDSQSSRSRKHLLKNHTGILWHASFAPDSQAVVTCGDDRTARLWTLTAGFMRPPSVLLKDDSLPGNVSHQSGVTCAAWFPKPAHASRNEATALNAVHVY